MAKLLLKLEGFGDKVIELRLGPNRFGRSPENDVQIEHSTVSAEHCEILLSDKGVLLRDCDSTNGTFVDGRPVKRAKLSAGQIVSLGDVDLLVETTDVTIAIPKFEGPRPAAPPVVRSDGSMLCPRHPQTQATHQCTRCREIMCDACVHRLRRRGGKLLKLCPVCSHQCEPIGGEKRKKKSLLAFLHTTVKLPFLRSTKRAG